MQTSYAAGRYSATATTEYDLKALPRKPYTAGVPRGVMYLHGAQGSAQKAIDTTAGYLPMLQRLVDHGGWPTVMADCGAVQGVSDVWGNATGMARMDDLYAYLTGPVGAATKVFLVGGSMGGLMAVLWAALNPTKVQAIALSIPVLDLQDVYVNNRSNLQAQIQAAYGGAPNYTTQSPLNRASLLAGIPTKIWYATDDPVTPDPSTNTTFAASVGSSASTASMGAVGHTFSATPTDQVLTFLAAAA